MADEVRGNGRIDTGTKTEASDGKTCDQPGVHAPSVMANRSATGL